MATCADGSSWALVAVDTVTFTPCSRRRSANPGKESGESVNTTGPAVTARARRAPLRSFGFSALVTLGLLGIGVSALVALFAGR